MSAEGTSTCTYWGASISLWCVW